MRKIQHWTSDGVRALCGSKSTDFTYNVYDSQLANGQVCLHCTKAPRVPLWEGWAKLATEASLTALLWSLQYEKQYKVAGLRASTGSEGPLRILLALYSTEQPIDRNVLTQLRNLLNDAIPQALLLMEQFEQTAQEHLDKARRIGNKVDTLRDLFITTQVTLSPL